MKRVLIIFANIVVLVSAGIFGYYAYINSSNSEIIVNCTPVYNTAENEMLVTCNVSDEDQIISSDNPLVLSLFDNDDVLLIEDLLSEGENTFTYTALSYNDQYSLTVTGSNLYQKAYVSQVFYDYPFSTAQENINIPSITIHNQLTTDTTFSFDVTLVDEDPLIHEITIALYNQDDTLLQSDNTLITPTMTFSYTSLLEENNYYVIVTVTYYINDFDETADTFETILFTTARTPVAPIVTISNVSNDYSTLYFELDFDDQDALNISYTVELLDKNSNILFSIVPTSSAFNIDVSSIVGNYSILVKASYALLSESYIDEEILSYHLYNNEYSNFFPIESLSRVDTSLPLIDYDDYINYLFTFLDEGLREFSITCESPVNCMDLIDNELYSGIPFGISNFLHPYYDINSIGYSYTSDYINFTTATPYSPEEMTLVDQEVHSILNTIIIDGMTNYDKILAIHDFIINTSYYDEDCYNDTGTCDNDHTAIGILFDHNAVCEGYAQTMDIFLRALRIPSFRLSSETHQWNVVYYNNAWYHVDTTWDDPVTEDHSNILSHTYFLISTEELMLLDNDDSHVYDITYTGFIE